MSYGADCVGRGISPGSSSTDTTLSIDKSSRGLLGQGSYGSVRFGTYQVGKQQPDEVAIKQYRTYSDRFSYEVRALKELNHRNIVKYFCSDGWSRSGQYLVMSYCNGGTLDQKLKKSENYFGISQSSFVKVFRDISDAMIYMHSENFYHLDIKPGNILIHVDNKEEIYILSDFDSARKVRLTGKVSDTLMSIKGTEPFMHPTFLQQLDISRASGLPQSKSLRRTNLIPYQADFYSFGCVMYQCATGKLRYYSERQNVYDAARHASKAPKGALAGFETGSGDMTYEHQLPATGPLSTPYRKKLEVILHDLSHKMWRTGEFKVEAEKFNNTRTVTFLHLGSATYLTVLLPEEKSCQDTSGASVGADGRVPVDAPLQNGQIGSNTENAQPISVKSLLEWNELKHPTTKLYFEGKKLEEDLNLRELQNISRDNPIIIEDYRELSSNTLKLKDIKSRPVLDYGNVQIPEERLQLLSEEIDKGCGVACFLVKNEQGFCQRADLIGKHYEERVNALKVRVDVARNDLSCFMELGNGLIKNKVFELISKFETVENDLSLNQAFKLESEGELEKVYTEIAIIKSYLNQRKFPREYIDVRTGCLNIKLVRKMLAIKNDQVQELYKEHEQIFNSYVQEMIDFGKQLDQKTNSLLRAEKLKNELCHEIQGEPKEAASLIDESKALMETMDNEYKTLKNIFSTEGSCVIDPALSRR